MDKKLILAVAGSGKTTYIINNLSLDRKYLVLCYTLENYNILRNEVIKKFQHFPKNIFLFSLFSFLYSFCYRPLCVNYAKNGLSFRSPSHFAPDVNSKTKQVYHSRLSKLIISSKLKYIERINKYFDYIFIDEVQDFASYDFDWLISLANSDKFMLAVGDFYQHTFDSSSCGNKNINLYKDKNKYIKQFKGFTVDTTTLSKSYRCSPDVCNFISENIGINITSHNNNRSEILFVSDKNHIDLIMKDAGIKKLFYQEHYKYSCNSNNWGNCKGNTYQNVCIILNPSTLKLFKTKQLYGLPPSTRAKFYVACSRTRENLYFIDQAMISSYKKT